MNTTFGTVVADARKAHDGFNLAIDLQPKKDVAGKRSWYSEDSTVLIVREYATNYIVPGTSNKCELYVGYYTKGGDNVSDIQVLADLTVWEVIEIGEYLNLPNEIIHKTPDDGLSNQSDEEKLGVKYKEIEKVLNKEQIDKKTELKINTLHQKNLHKINIPTFKK